MVYNRGDRIFLLTVLVDVHAIPYPVAADTGKPKKASVS